MTDHCNMNFVPAGPDPSAQPPVSTENVPVADAVPPSIRASVPATAERDATKVCIQTHNFFGFEMDQRCTGNADYCGVPPREGDDWHDTGGRRYCDHHVPLYADAAPSCKCCGKPAAHFTGTELQTCEFCRFACRAPGPIDTNWYHAVIDPAVSFNSERSAYRDGVGVGYAAGLTDLREALLDNQCYGVTHAREFLRLLTALSERCDQIAEAQQ